MPIFTMLILILAGVALIFIGKGANGWDSSGSQVLAVCGISLIAFVVILILIWP